MIQHNRNTDCEEAIKCARPCSYTMIRIAGKAIKFMEKMDNKDLMIITRKKSLIKWNIDRDIIPKFANQMYVNPTNVASGSRGLLKKATILEFGKE